MTFVIGLTGSIGMGKSTTAKLFAEFGCATWEADEAVHRLYRKKGAAVEPISNLFPSAIVNGAVSREKLKSILLQEPSAFSKLEKIIHPLVASDRASFIEKNIADIVVLEIPLLFETGEEKNVDAVVCVVSDEITQKQRVFARGTMTEDQLLQILARQMPIDKKLKKSDFVINTDNINLAREQVSKTLKKIYNRLKNARNRS